MNEKLYLWVVYYWLYYMKDEKKKTTWLITLTYIILNEREIVKLIS